MLIDKQWYWHGTGDYRPSHTGPMRGGGAGGASAPGPGCLGGPGGKQKHRCWPSWIFFFLIGSQCMGDPGF